MEEQTTLLHQLVHGSAAVAPHHMSFGISSHTNFTGRRGSAHNLLQGLANFLPGLNPISGHNSVHGIDGAEGDESKATAEDGGNATPRQNRATADDGEQQMNGNATPRQNKVQASRDVCA